MARRFACVCLAVLGFGAGPPAAPIAPTDCPPDDLAFAAACLDRGEDTSAAAHLARYLACHPEQPFVRFSLAELHWRRGRLSEAGAEYERFLHETATPAGMDSRVLQAHVRLVAIAEQSADGYSEHLHRGIGLRLLAGQTTDALAAEGLLCKAAGELNLAARRRPNEARPHYYLHQVWERLGQSQPAERHRVLAAALAGNAELSPAERADLALAATQIPIR